MSNAVNVNAVNVNAVNIDVDVRAAAAAAAVRARAAAFDDARYADFVAAAKAAANSILALGVGAEAVLDDLLALAAEGVALSAVGSATHPTLLGELLGRDVPAQLGACGDAREAAALLALAWNIGEGAATAAPFVDPYLVATLRHSGLDLRHLRAQVTTALARVLSVEHAPTWRRFSVHVLDLATTRADFLPGTLHAAAPGLLCVHDRRRDDAAVVIAMEHGGHSHVVGPSSCLGDAWPADEKRGGIGNIGDIGDIDAEDGVVLVGDVAVPTPTLSRAYWSALVPRGFVCVSAVDSQRVWILESALAGAR